MASLSIISVATEGERIRPLYEASWAETFAEQGFSGFAPTMGVRAAWEQKGDYLLAMATNDAGEPVGICAFYLCRCGMTGRLYASNDVIYLAPEYRKGWHAKQLWDFTVHQILARGIKDIRIAAPINSKLSWWEGMGYSPRSITLAKVYP